VRVIGCQPSEGVAGADGCRATAAAAARRGAMIRPRVRGGQGGEVGPDSESRRSELLLGGSGGRWESEPPEENTGGSHGVGCCPLCLTLMRAC